jgi:predicted dehydrogenase
MPSKVNVAVLGTGFVNEVFHMPSFSEIESANVVCVAGTSREKTEAFAKKWNIRKVYYGEDAIEKACVDPEVMLVDVGLPNHLHLKTIKLAAENHKHLICEKPLGRNGTEAREALDAVEKHGVIHCYAENQVFIPQVSRATQFINNGVVGNVTWIRAREAHSGPHSKWFWDPDLSGGGALCDLGCHTIEVSRHLLGKPKPVEVAAWTARLVHDMRAEDNSLTIVRYETGAIGQCENSYSAKGGFDMRAEIYGSEGSIFLDPTRETGIRVFTVADKPGYIVEKADVSKGWLYPTWREHEVFGVLPELQHFVTCVSKGEMPRETFKDGYLVNKIMDAAYAAARDKKWVKITDN